LFLGLSALAVGLTVSHAAGGWAALRRLFVPVIILGAVMGLVQFGVAMIGFWNIASFSGSLAGLLVGFPLARRYSENTAPGTASSEPGGLDRRRLLVALSGYAVLIAITLVIQVIPAVKSFLGQVVIEVQFPEVRTALGYITPAGLGRTIPIFRHAGTSLIYAALLAYALYGRAGLYKPGAAGRILNGTLKRVMSSSVGIASMVAMATVMENAGMTDTLARGLAEGMGMAFPLISPWIGALGAFMTGSNTNANVVFGALQLRTAELLKYPVAVILAAQTSGAGLASVLAPTKVVVGASTAGMAGQEGEVMRKLLVYTGLLLVLISLLAGLFSILT
jgi:lactate permease